MQNMFRFVLAAVCMGLPDPFGAQNTGSSSKSFYCYNCGDEAQDPTFACLTNYQNNIKDCWTPGTSRTACALEALFTAHPLYGGRPGPLIRRYCPSTDLVGRLWSKIKPNSPKNYMCEHQSQSHEMPSRRCLCIGEKCNGQTFIQLLLAPVFSRQSVFRPAANGSGGTWQVTEITTEEQWIYQPKPVVKPGPGAGAGGSTSGGGSSTLSGPKDVVDKNTNSSTSQRICDPRFPDEADCRPDPAKRNSIGLSKHNTVEETGKK